MWKPDPSIIITAEQKTAEALEQAWTSLRAERDQRFDETEWMVQRHTEQRLLDLVTTLSEAQFADLLAYRQALRDLPENTDDPAEPVWPEWVAP